MDEEDSRAEELSCPSAPATPGAKLFGLVQEDGRVGIFAKALTVDEAFLEKARRGRAPEKRFRFSSPCLQDGCGQWTDGQCGVIKRVLAMMGPEVATGAESPLRPCAIRGSCRWFAERGRVSCGACVDVVTDTREDLSVR